VLLQYDPENDNSRRRSSHTQPVTELSPGRDAEFTFNDGEERHRNGAP
jgi:hypothetical protein